MANPTLLLSLLTLIFLSSFAQSNDITLHLINVHSPFSPQTTLSWTNTILQLQSNDKARFTYLSDKTTAPIASGALITHNPTYIVKATIGTPPQTLFMAIDTSYDAQWVPCAGCIGCPPATAYDPSKSTTSTLVGCMAPWCSQDKIPSSSCDTASHCTFHTTYGSSNMAATLLDDNFTLANDLLQGYKLSCIYSITGGSIPSQGMLGLGRGGPLSFLSQTSTFYQSTFSYCLPSYESPNFSGSLRLGINNQPKNIQTTPLLQNPRRPSLYYVNLIGIRVGRKVVDIPPTALAFDPSTGAGTIFDSGTVYSMLSAPVYAAVRDEFRRRMGNAAVSSLGGFDTCYTVPVKMRTIALMFPGFNMSLPQENFLVHGTYGNISCLAMAANPATGVNSALNVIASYQQQNRRVLIDVPNSKLGVANEKCS